MIELEQLKELALGSGAVTRECRCAASPFPGWERVATSFPEAQMRWIGTLNADPGGEPTYQEWNPPGRNYWSEDAPVAVHYFPYNRCNVEQCGECERVYLRYTEGGGYYVEQRIRALNDPLLITDKPVPLT